MRDPCRLDDDDGGDAAVGVDVDVAVDIDIAGAVSFGSTDKNAEVPGKEPSRLRHEMS